jgi:hypothetical protein
MVVVGGIGRAGVEMEGGSRVDMGDLAGSMGLVVVVDTAGSHCYRLEVVDNIVAVWMGW